ncbi:MAG TPA: hypothetical protein VLH37_11110 [Bacteroidales bacterium]|nr:hypothetical protein [Bacteroidales bacterium]
MRLLTSTILLSITFWCFGQGAFRLNIEFDGNFEKPPARFAETRFFPDSIIMMQGIDSLLAALFRFGYLDAEKQQISGQLEAFTVRINQGRLYHWELRNTNINQEVLKAQRLLPYFNGTPLPFYRFNELRNSIIHWYENQGFPFARLHTDSVIKSDALLKATLRIDPSLPIFFENVNLRGNVNLARGFVANHTGIAEGTPYSEGKAGMAAIRLSELPFVRITGEPTIEFTPGTALVTVPVARRPANRFEGVAGVTNDPLQGNRIQITGHLNLSLVNLLERGEQIAMNWQGLTQGTQRLMLQANYPFVLSTPISTALLFSLHRQDTSYINLRQRLALTWQSPQRIRISVFAERLSSELLSTGRLMGTAALPLIDSRTTLYGLESSVSTPGFLAGPMDGSMGRVYVSAGTKSIRKNPNLPESFYQNVSMRQPRYSFGVFAESRLPVSQLSRLVFSLQSQGIFGERVFGNEWFRIGGIGSLKGFNEESILATFYSVIKGEWRYFTGEQSYLSLLFNAAYYERNLTGEFANGWPWGVAAGINLETTPGIITVFFAMGEGPETQFSFRNTKVHIGFTSLF